MNFACRNVSEEPHGLWRSEFQLLLSSSAPFFSGLLVVMYELEESCKVKCIYV